APIASAACVLMVQWRTRRAQARYLDQFRAGDRYCMTGEGLQAEVPGGRIGEGRQREVPGGLIGWSSIAGILSSQERLTILTDRGGTLILTKAAFAGQDVETLGAQRRRRWSTARAVAG